MKVLLINGSGHQYGCTYTALAEIEKILNSNQIETEIIWLGLKPIAGCIGCGSCIKTDECFRNDIVNDFIKKSKEADGFIFGTPVHYASASGMLTSFMDRAFYGRSKIFKNKPAAGVVSCRRGGATATLDMINKYFAMNNMPIVTSQYWNMVHGNNPDEVKQDLEGMQTMRTLGNNMSWMLKCIECGKNNGIKYPENEEARQVKLISEQLAHVLTETDQVMQDVQGVEAITSKIGITAKDVSRAINQSNEASQRVVLSTSQVQIAATTQEETVLKLKQGIEQLTANVASLDAMLKLYKL